MSNSPGIAEEIRKALDAAEVGQWLKVEFFNGTMEVWQSIDNTGIARIIGNNDAATANAHLIANAPTWLRSLLAENDHWQQCFIDANRDWARVGNELLDERNKTDELTAQLTESRKLWGECEAQNQQLREDAAGNEQLLAMQKDVIGQLREELKQLEHRNTVITLANETLGRYFREGKEELEQVKKVRDEWKLEAKQSREELAWCLDKIEALKKERDMLENDLKMEKQDREIWEAEVHKLALERHELIDEVDAKKDVIFDIRSELAAKDKEMHVWKTSHQLMRNYLLEHREATPYGLYEEQITNVLDESRSILSQYKETPHET